MKCILTLLFVPIVAHSQSYQLDTSYRNSNSTVEVYTKARQQWKFYSDSVMIMYSNYDTLNVFTNPKSGNGERFRVVIVNDTMHAYCPPYGWGKYPLKKKRKVN